MKENENQTIFFDEEVYYEINGTKYVIISHFKDDGEDIIGKITRLIKSDMQNTVAQNL